MLYHNAIIEVKHGAFVTMATGRTAKEAAKMALDKNVRVKMVGCTGGDHYQVAMAALETTPFNDPTCRKVGAVSMGGECWLLFGRE